VITAVHHFAKVFLPEFLRSYCSYMALFEEENVSEPHLLVLVLALLLVDQRQHFGVPSL